MKPARQREGDGAAGLGECFVLEKFPHRAVIYRPGDRAERLYVIKSGMVKLLRPRNAQSLSLVSVLGQGELFGELFLPEGCPLEETAVSSGIAEVWSIDGGGLRSQMVSNPGLSIRLLQAYSVQALALRRRAAALAFKGVAARLAELLLCLCSTQCQRFPATGEPFLSGVTQQDLADLVGASRAFVSGLLNQMKVAGVLAGVSRGLCIRNPEALRRIASEWKSARSPGAG